MKDDIKIKGQVIVIVTTPSEDKKVYKTKNLVTSEGGIYYALRGAGSSITGNFSSITLGLGTSGDDPATSSVMSSISTWATSGTMTTGYPLVDDAATANTGGGPSIVSYSTSIGTGTFTDIDRVCLFTTGKSITSNEPLLMYAKFSSSFSKGASDTIKVFINHSMTGV